MDIMLSNGLVIEKMDLSAIKLRVREPARVTPILESDGFAFASDFNNDRRLRIEVYQMLKVAQASLPLGVRILVGEAYRPMTRQVRMWNEVWAKIEREYPVLPEEEKKLLCENFIANPYDGIGSGHQAACAVDVTLCDAAGIQFDMGTAMQEFNELTRTDAAGLRESVVRNRTLLRTGMEKAGFVNYPAEWWHFSYGDHQWAFLSGRTEAVFGMLDLSEEAR